MPSSRRDFVRWVLYLGAVAALPAVSSVADLPHDILEGISYVPKRLADLSGNGVAYRAAEEAAFERMMRDVWREKNGSARYVRVHQDMGLQPARDCRGEDGDLVHLPERYESFFQYRRA